MNKPYLVIKQYQDGYNHRTFETVDHAHAGIDDHAGFPGDYACIYDLVGKKYLHIEQLPGMDSDHIQQIINQYLNNG